MQKKDQPSETEASVGAVTMKALAKAITRRTLLKGALVTAPLLLAGPTLWLPRKAAAAGHFGPSTTTEPYLVPSVSGVELTAILTVGDSIGGYRMVGIPDGLGAFHSHGHEFTLLMNHELGGTSGIVRRHGSKGAFVSQWVIDHKYLKVIEGQDFTQSANNVFSWDPATITCEGR